MEQVAHSNQVKLKALREVIKGEKTILEISEEAVKAGKIKAPPAK